MPFRKSGASLSSQLSPDARRNYRIDFVATTVFSLFNVVNNQFYVPMAIDAGATGIQVGILTAAPAVGLLFSPLWASWIERTSPKPFVVYPNLIARFLLFLPAFFGTPTVFVMSALVFHLLMGIQAPAYAALLTKVFPSRYRGRLMGNVRTSMGIVMIPLAYLVGRWSDQYGSSGLLIAAAIGGITSITIYSLIREIVPDAPPQPVATQRTTIRQQWRLVKENRELGLFLLASFFSGFANMMAQPMYQLIQMEVLQLSFVQIGWARTTYFACLLGAFFAIGHLLDKYPPQRVIACGIGAYALVPLLYGLSESYPAVIIGSGIQGVGDAIWDIGILAYILRLAPGREAVAFGLHLLLFGIRGTIGPLLATGLEPVLPFSVMLLAASLCAAIGTVIYMLGNRKQHRAQAISESAK